MQSFFIVDQKVEASLYAETAGHQGGFGIDASFAKAFGVMPSIRSAAGDWRSQYPQFAAFLDAAGYAKGVPTSVGANDVVTDLNSKLASLKSADIASILSAEQKNLSAVVTG